MGERSIEGGVGGGPRKVIVTLFEPREGGISVYREETEGKGRSSSFSTEVRDGGEDGRVREESGYKRSRVRVKKTLRLFTDPETI